MIGYLTRLGVRPSKARQQATATLRELKVKGRRLALPAIKPLKVAGTRLKLPKTATRLRVGNLEAARTKAANKLQKAEDRLLASQTKQGQKAADHAKKALDKLDKRLAKIKGDAAKKYDQGQTKAAKDALRQAKKDTGDDTIAEQVVKYVKGRLNLPNMQTAISAATGQAIPGANPDALKRNRDCEESDAKARRKLEKQARCRGVPCGSDTPQPEQP